MIRISRSVLLAALFGPAAVAPLAFHSPHNRHYRPFAEPHQEPHHNNAYFNVQAHPGDFDAPPQAFQPDSSPLQAVQTSTGNVEIGLVPPPPGPDAMDPNDFGPQGGFYPPGGPEPPNHMEPHNHNHMNVNMKMNRNMEPPLSPPRPPLPVGEVLMPDQHTSSLPVGGALMPDQHELDVQQAHPLAGQQDPYHHNDRHHEAPPPAQVPPSPSRSQPSYFPTPGTVYRSAGSKGGSRSVGDGDNETELNGHTVGNGKYLMTTESGMSTSKKSAICKAYRRDKDGNPVGDPVVIKISKNKDQLQREAENFELVAGRDTADLFVDIYDFLPNAELEATLPSHMIKDINEYGAIVMEEGSEDLRQFLKKQGPLEGEELREIAETAAQTAEAFHRKGMVWTELKSNNFVIQEDGKIKAIDLESAVPNYRGRNRDYTPQVVPPEFAQALMQRRVPQTPMEYSFDVWSLGMTLYEMAVGKSYFEGLKHDQIISELANLRRADLGHAQIDPQLKDLIAWCLEVRKEDRPSMQQVLDHPYFR